MDLAPHWAAFKAAKKEEDLFVFISRGLTYFGLFMVPLLHFKVTSGLNASDASFTVAAIFLFLSRRPPPRAPRTPAWYVGAFLFLLSGVWASAQSPHIGSSLIVVVNSIYLFFVLQYLLRQQLGTPRLLRRGMAAFVLGASLSAFVAVLQSTLHIFLFAPASTDIGGGASRAIGLTNQPDLAGVAFALGIVFALNFVLEDGLRKHRFFGACIVLMAIGVLLSGSVSGFACTIVGLFVYFIARGASLKTILMVFLSFAVVYVLVFGVVDRGSKLDPITRVEKTTNSTTGTGTLQLRVDTWKAAWSEIVDKPVTGHGLDQGTLALYYDQYLFVYYPPHNLILLYWYGGGILMLVALLIMMGSAFSRCLSGRLKGRNRDPMRDAILSGCVITLLFSMQAPELVDRWFWLPFLLAMCLRPLPDADPPTLTAATLDVPATAGNGAPRRVTGTVGRSAVTTSPGHLASS